MATITFTVDAGNYADDEPASGQDVLQDRTDIKNFLEGGNLDSNNISLASAFPWTGKHSWTISDADNTNLALVVSAVMAANKYGYKFSSSAAQVNSALLYATLSNASSSVPIFDFVNAGTGATVRVTNSGNAAAFDGTQSSTSASTNTFTASQAGTGALFGGSLRTLSSLNSVLLSKKITTLTTIDNTATETAISDLSITLPADFLKAGTTLRGKIWGTMDTPGAGPATARIRVCYGGTITGGGTALLDSGAVTPTTSLSGSLILVDFTLTCLTTGSSGTIEAQGIVSWGSNTVPASRGLGTGATGAGNTSAVTINTTASKDLVITFTWGSAVSGCTAKFRAGHVEILT